MHNTRYSTVAVALHWAIAALIIGQIIGGLYMHKLPNSSGIKFDLYQLHKSFGLSILVLTFLRLGWRFSHKVPALPGAMPDWQKLAARATHWGFYALLILTPFAGLAMVSVSPTDIPTKWFGMIPIPHLPFFAGVADRAAMEDELKEVHEYLAFGIIGLLVLHVGAALKHRFVNRDNVLQSMVPAHGREWLSAGGILAALAAAGAIYLMAPAPSSNAAALSPANLSGANWAVDYDASRLGFTGEEKTRKFEGEFKDFTAAIYFDPDGLGSSWINVEVATSSASTGDQLRDSNLPSGEWFGVKEHPVATFSSRDIRSMGGDAYEAVGVLTIKEFSREVTAPFTLVVEGDTAVATGGADLIRTDFGLGADAAWLEDEAVALKVGVEFEITATRSAP